MHKQMLVIETGLLIYKYVYEFMNDALVTLCFNVGPKCQIPKIITLMKSSLKVNICI